MVVDLTSSEMITRSLPISGASTGIDQQMVWTSRGQQLLAGADHRGVIIHDPGTREQRT